MTTISPPLNIDAQLERIALLTRIATLDSCLQIYSFLILFGRTTAAQLRQKTGLSNATVFRSLALLSEAGIVDKEEDPDVPDRRYNLYYFVTGNLMGLSKKLVPKDVAKELEKRGRTKELQAWYQALETLPLTLNRFASQYVLSMKYTAAESESEEEVKIIKMMAFCVDSIDDVETLLMKLQDFLGKFESLRGQRRESWKKPLQNPVVLSVSIVAPAPESVPCEPTGVLRLSNRQQEN